MPIESRLNFLEQSRQGLEHYREVMHPDNVGRRIAFTEMYNLFPDRVTSFEKLSKLPREVTKPLGTKIGRFMSSLTQSEYNRIAVDTWEKTQQILKTSTSQNSTGLPR